MRMDRRFCRGVGFGIGSEGRGREEGREGVGFW